MDGQYVDAFSGHYTTATMAWEWDEPTALPFSQPPPPHIQPIHPMSFFSQANFAINPERQDHDVFESYPSNLTVLAPASFLLPQPPAPMIVEAPEPPYQQPATRSQATKYSHQQWEAKKSIIRQLWMLEDRPWQDTKNPQTSVQTILKIEHDFPVTKRQFLKKMKEWKYVKNVTDRTMRAIDKVDRYRIRNSGKATTFCVRGQIFPSRKLDRWRKLRERPTNSGQSNAIASPIPEESVLIELEVTYHTPTPTENHTIVTTPSPVDRLYNVEDNLEAREHSFDSSDISCLLQNLRLQTTNLEGHSTVAEEDGHILCHRLDLEFRRVSGDLICRTCNRLVLLSHSSPLPSLSTFNASIETGKARTSRSMAWYRSEAIRLRSELLLGVATELPIEERLAKMSSLGDALYGLSVDPIANKIYHHVALASKRIYGSRSPKTVRAYCDSVNCLITQRRISLAAKVHNSLKERTQDLIACDNALLQGVMLIGIRLDLALNNWLAAEVGCRDLIRMLLTLNGLRGLDLFTPLDRLAWALLNSNRYDEAEKVALEILDISHRGLFTPSMIIEQSATRILGSVYAKQGRYDEGDRILRNLLSKCKAAFGPEHMETLETLSEIARCFLEKGKFDDARRLFETILTVQRKLLGYANPVTALALHNVGVVYTYLSRHVEASRCFRQSLEIYKEVDEPNSLDISRACYSIGATHFNMTEFEESLIWFERSEAGYRSKFGDDYTWVKNSRAMFDRAMAEIRESEAPLEVEI